MTVSSADVREDLIRSMRLDLVGPCSALNPSDAEYENERLPMAPSKWYLTGFLVPREAPDEQREEDTSQEELDLGGDSDSEADEDAVPDKAPARRVPFPSSIGISVLVSESERLLEASVSWGEYDLEKKPNEGEGESSSAARDTVWIRHGRTELVPIPIPEPREKPRVVPIPNSGGLKLVVTSRRADGTAAGLPKGSRSLAVFVVNERPPAEEPEKDRAFVFQVCLELTSRLGFTPRPDPRGGSDDWDDRVAELQFADVVEFAIGHGVSADWSLDGAQCTSVWTTWMPRCQVPFVRPGDVDGVMVEMERIATAELSDLQAGLRPLIEGYGKWLADQRALLPERERRRKTAEQVLQQAEIARGRIEAGINALSDPDVYRAFQLANAAMADAARRRDARQRGRRPSEVAAPRWRTFQLAFFLLNLRGLASPEHRDREIVDLLFFPTGGGKTEAYLGISAFILVLRRLTNEGIGSAGVSVIMRYTLRLLTLDQLGRAAGVICALEQQRATEPRLGDRPFEIGLWVGRAATPNRLGAKGDQDPNTARARVRQYQKNSAKSASPIPLEECPWCGTRFTKDSFALRPTVDYPTDLRVFCANPRCEFTGERPLPIVAVDQPLYRRLPCFIIATVDKFASLPFEGRSGALFGAVERYDGEGFYGPVDPGVGRLLPGGALPPPDLIIQDELHLISGPLGTIAGLYETAIDWLCTRFRGEHRIRPKVIASTATVRRAQKQIRALFARESAQLFPPASIDRRKTFFSETASETEAAPRAYLGIAAPGRSLKVVMLRVYIALLSASLRAYRTSGGERSGPNPADPYLSLLGYFNALRELGGARRIVEDEVGPQVRNRASRKRVGEAQGLFDDREIEYEVLELTSRVTTDKVAGAKARLEVPWSESNKGRRVDVALATNMISVGLDITRLGLMVVLGQPKGSAEYIQATSRVGRDPTRPGLVVTLLTLNKPRDRSHYERFGFYHRTFYRSVEATSVTPFSPRALDRVLPALVVALARLGVPSLTPSASATDVDAARERLGFILDALSRRVEEHDLDRDRAASEELRLKVQRLASELLDQWSTIANEQRDAGARLRYQQYERVEKSQPLLRDPLDPKNLTLDPPRNRFKAARSMRDVEPEVLLLLRR